MTEELPVLDDGVISELRVSVGGDDGFVAELAATYLAEGPEHLGAMEDAAARGDVAGVVRPAHTLKSSSAALGAMRLSELCRRIEHAARDGRAEGLEAAVAEVRATWELTASAMRARGMSA